MRQQQNEWDLSGHQNMKGSPRERLLEEILASSRDSDICQRKRKLHAMLLTSGVTNRGAVPMEHPQTHQGTHNANQVNIVERRAEEEEQQNRHPNQKEGRQATTGQTPNR